MNILIIEDQAPTTRFIESVVIKHYPKSKIISVNTTEELEEIISNTDLALTITDLDFDGDKRFVALQKCYEMKIPCIVYSAHYNSSFVEKAMKYRPRAYICKLGDISEFESAIRNFGMLYLYKCQFVQKNNRNETELKEPKLKAIHEKILLQTIKGIPHKVIAKNLGKKVNTINSYIKDMVDTNECSLNELIHRYSNWKKIQD